MPERVDSNHQVYFPKIRSEYIGGHGVLTLRTDLPRVIPDNFKEELLATQPWKNMYPKACSTSTKVDIIDLAGIRILQKARRNSLIHFRRMFKDMRRDYEESFGSEYRRNRAQSSIPVALFAKAQTMKERFQQAYPRETLHVEEPIASFTDERSGQIYMYYLYYPPSKGVSPLLDTTAEAKKIRKRLEGVNVHFGDGFEYVITDGPDGEQQLVVVDHEDVYLREDYPRA